MIFSFFTVKIKEMAFKNDSITEDPQKRKTLRIFEKFSNTWIRKDLPNWFSPIFWLISILYVIVTAESLNDSWLTKTDSYFYNFSLFNLSELHRFDLQIAYFVTLGRRLIAMIIVGIYVFLISRKLKTITPIVYYICGSILFVGSVAFMKLSTGRIGPLYTNDPSTIWAGGDIFPSGHTTGAVVLYGVAAMSTPVVYRKIMRNVAIFLSLGVGFGTIFLRTHWFSDVIGAYLDGILVLMMTYAIAPHVESILLRKFSSLKKFRRDFKKKITRANL